MVVVAAAGASAWAGERNVTVCMNSGSVRQVAHSAQAIASRIFAGIEVGIEWRNGSCPSSPETIKVSLSDRTPKTHIPNALAHAFPYEGTTIVIFYDRIQQGVEKARVGHLLAYVLVHEITHILQGVARHSTSGIMKARWDSGDYFEMQCKRLDFTSLDVELIYLGLKTRASRLTVSEPVLVASR